MEMNSESATPPPRNREEIGSAPVARASISLMAVSIGLQVVIVPFIWLSRYQFRQQIEQFEIPFPPLTAFALALFFPALLSIFLVASIVKQLIPRAIVMKNTWNAIGIVVALLALAVYLAGVFNVLMVLIESLS
jgi:hypothetical protein